MCGHHVQQRLGINRIVRLPIRLFRSHLKKENEFSPSPSTPENFTELILDPFHSTREVF